ncbi:hypothetical protein TNCT_685881 [Trichonephila clavata]|uniref:Uncharacterized protein n=1 Tax=Trichonephila clavata TaxID=2740835 RepID=A0A8X6IX81_TRICU|nr:hypothetical protein TNCT_685881 [Trichonephila clavata]
MREICALEMDEKERKQIGDKGLIVELDESLFVKEKITLGVYYHSNGFSAEFAEKRKRLFWLLYLTEAPLPSWKKFAKYQERKHYLFGLLERIQDK